MKDEDVGEAFDDSSAELAVAKEGALEVVSVLGGGASASGDTGSPVSELNGFCSDGSLQEIDLIK